MAVGGLQEHRWHRAGSQVLGRPGMASRGGGRELQAWQGVPSFPPRVLEPAFGPEVFSSLSNPVPAPYPSRVSI